MSILTRETIAAGLREARRIENGYRWTTPIDILRKLGLHPDFNAFGKFYGKDIASCIYGTLDCGTLSTATQATLAFPQLSSSRTIVYLACDLPTDVEATTRASLRLTAQP